MPVTYEWCVETNDEYGDIIETEFSDDFPGKPALPDQELVLIRDEGDDVRGLIDRSWAYLKSGKLPDFFQDSSLNDTGFKVPKRFHEILREA